jgi:sulfur-oxidizing protein SoxZ
MAEPIRIRARWKAGVTDIVVLAPHPMETGMRTDATGRPVPAHHITRLQVQIAGRPVIDSTMTIAVAKDPLLSLRYRGAQVGDAVRVSWVDSRGERRVDEGVVTAA